MAEGGGITTRDVLQELREFRRDTNDRLNTLQNTLSSMATTVAVEQTHRQALAGTLDKHDRRINSLSRWRWWLAGAATSALALGVTGGPEVARLVGG